MEKPPKNYYREPINGYTACDLEEAKDLLIDGAADNLFNSLRTESGASTKSADDLWEDRETIIKQAKTLITTLTNPSKLLSVYELNGKPEPNS